MARAVDAARARKAEKGKASWALTTGLLWRRAVLGKAVRGRPKLLTAFAVLAICAGLALGSAGEVLAREYLRTYTFGSDVTFGKHHKDANGSVPEYKAYVEDIHPDPGIKTIGLTRFTITFTSTGGEIAQAYIHYDYNQMNNFCATQEDFNQIHKHERAHSRGWHHGEGTPDTNGAYKPGIGNMGPGGNGCG